MPDPEETEREALARAICDVKSVDLPSMVVLASNDEGDMRDALAIADSILAAGFRHLSESEIRREAWIEGVMAKSNSSSIFDRDVIAQCPYPKEADRG